MPAGANQGDSGAHGASLAARYAEGKQCPRDEHLSEENGMLSRSHRASKTALVSFFLLAGPAAFGLSSHAWAGPPSYPGTAATPVPEAPRSGQQTWPTTRRGDQLASRREQAARDLAISYLNLWSAPNRVTLKSASSFYGPTVTFHGRTRTLGSVLAEKRRLAERWPDRTYYYRPDTTQVTCEARGDRCTVWSIFRFSAANSREGRHSLGIGEHELVVSLATGKPVIESEDSRVVQRGRGNMSSLLEAGL